MAQQRNLSELVATGRTTFELLYAHPMGGAILTSIAELKNTLEPNASVEEVRFEPECVMTRELLDALNGLKAKEACAIPMSFESVEVYKDFLNVVAETDVIQLNAKPPVSENLLKTEPFASCRVLNLGDDAVDQRLACVQMGLTKEDICDWLHTKYQWEDGVRVMTINVEPKQAAEIAKHVVKEFDSDEEPRAYELFLHDVGDAFGGFQHTAFNAVTRDFISVSCVVESLLIKRSSRAAQHGRLGGPTAAHVVPAKTLCDLLQKAVE